MLTRVFVVNFSGGIAMLTHRQGYFCLDKAFALIEGHPPCGCAGGKAGHPSPEKRKTGAWWKRKLLGAYAPALEKTLDGRVVMTDPGVVTAAPEQRE